MQDRRLLQKVEQDFSPADSTSSNRGVLGEDSLKDNARKRSFRSERDRRSAQEIKTIILKALKVASAPKKSQDGKSTTPGWMITRSEK